MHVLKFGGTSLGTPERMKAVARLCTGEGRRIVVLSAISGTTNQLTEIAGFLFNREHDRAVTELERMQAHYYDFADELLSTPEGKKKGRELIAAHINFMRSFTLDMFTRFEEREILAQGELMSTALFHYYLEESGIDSVLLSALDFMRIDKEQEPDSWYIESNLARLLNQHENNSLFITQGYICRNAYGAVDNLKRGGSDYSASLIGVAIRAREIQIWTDIDGMHNNDPRVVSETRPIHELSFDEAAELAYFGAKILHPSSVRPARDADIPVRLKNTLNPEAAGTLIKRGTAAPGIRAIAAKDGITAIRIQSGRMLLAYGFLRNVFEVFERYRTPIDMITTSEVAVSLTVDESTHLEAILKELKKFGRVEVDRDQVIVCIVGQFDLENQGDAAQVFNSLKGVPVRMISYGGSPHNVSVLVESKHKTAALEALNRGLFNLGQS